MPSGAVSSMALPLTKRLWRDGVVSDQSPERFREVEPLCILGEMKLAICPNAKDIKVRMWTDDSRAYLTIPEARALRDWLTKALPEEKL